MMNIKQAKQEIVDTVQAYLLKNEYGEYVIPRVHQRPVLLLGAPGIGKTQIMEQAARECKVALVAYTITHHTRQSAIGLPFISKKEYGGKEYSATEYTMRQDLPRESCLSMRSTAFRRPWHRQCFSSCSAKLSEIMRFRKAG